MGRSQQHTMVNEVEMPESSPEPALSGAEWGKPFACGSEPVPFDSAQDKLGARPKG